jgi:anti-sigma-K factor RskA
MIQELHHLAAAYALDALDPEERAAFEAHYPDCDVCSVEVAEYRETAAILAAGTAASPSPDLKSRVMGEITRTRQISPLLPDRIVDLAERRRDRTRRIGLAAAVAAAVVAIVGFVAILRPAPGTSSLEEVIAAPDAVVTALEGDDGALRVVWSAELERLVVFGSDLPDPGDDVTYELWFVLADDAGVAPAGLFVPDDSGVIRTVLDVDDRTGAGFAVTIEPEGGSEQPTGPILYSGTV